ncbi:glycosyltransferase family 2 protein [Reichenbachiella agarivorans]|uniref:Glycosyltransferase family 2 protein n=1 Tax=Reichenbachiella agarivorans TaxID=2979464 RepID=A0ABY6CNZ0_9BACT|nr:glycosyltransferase family 2 protein [Reichenbachiella agarivorans]UXP31750.1 glycosyltransferase family 2 protein [Reichenbachiella agarivorans]
MAKTAVVILNYNGVDYLRLFLPTVVKYSQEADVIVADNGSTDASLDYLRENHPDLRLIAFEKNYGFTGGYNRAIEQIDHTYCVLLNSDIEVTPGWIHPIINFMDHDTQISACQPKIKAFHDKQYFEYAGAAGGFIDSLSYPYCRGRIFDTLEKDMGQYDQNLEIFWATGAAMFVRTEDYKKLGGLDEDFFAHMEEIDLCWRMQLSGKQIYCIPESVVYHVGGGTLAKSNARKTYYNFRNNLSMLFKNEGILDLIWKLPLRMGLDWLSAIKFWKDNSAEHFWAVLKAHRDFIMRLPYNINKRKSITRLPGVSTRIKRQGFLPYLYFVKKIRHFSEF